MLVAIVVLFPSVVRYPPTEAVFEADTTKGGIAFQLFSEDMCPFFPSLFFSWLFPHSGRSVG